MSKSRLFTVMALSLMTLQARAGDKSLVLYLPLDEGAGATAKDVSTYHNPGTLAGGAAWVPGAKGTALAFASNGAHVTVPEIPQYDVTAAVSLLAWVRATTVPNWARVIDKSQYQTTGFDLVLTQNVGLPRLEFFVNNTTSLVDGTTVVADDEWHFIVGTFGSKRLRMYVNGQREGETQSVGQVDINPNNWPLMIGAEASSNGGQQFFGSIDEVAMYDRELAADEVMAIFQNGMPVAELAADPQPKNEAVDVPRDVVLSWTPGGFAAAHDVYFGAVLEDVTGADRDQPKDVLASKGQLDTTFDPDGLLDYGLTYYWRVDEVNAAPDDTIFKGDVWSFKVEPYSYALTNVKATASSVHNATMGPEKTTNGSGLDPEGVLHSNDGTAMWLSKRNAPAPTWIQYEFDRAYKLDQMLVWNYNGPLESSLGLGAKDVNVAYSVDGNDWTPLGAFEFAPATGEAPCAADTTVEFDGAVARYVKLTINSNWYDMLVQYGLSEVRFFYVPVQAFAPQPADGATRVGIEAVLDWRPGREAESHEVYLGGDPNAMTRVGTTTGHGYAPASLNFGSTYYWRIDEIGGGGPYEGEVWSFTTEDYAVVDDFESYNDEEGKGTRIYETWTDGWEDPAKGGSLASHPDAPYAEQTIVHGGRQSMPLTYDNTAALHYSEVEQTFDPPQDWTEHGITALVLYFRGQVGNSPAPLYVKINGKKVPFGNNAATAMPLWRQWTIPLADTGAGLQSVNTLTIGVEGGATGTVFIDDIRLYVVAPQAVSPADPGKTGLQALYTMDGNAQDSSGNNRHGTVNGTASYDAGYASQALVFNGTNTFVDLPIGTLIATLTDTTVATHVYFGGGNGAWQRVFDFGSGSGASPYMFLCPRQGTAGNMRFAIRTATVPEQMVNSSSPLTVGWHHMAVTIDSQARTAILYVDGERIASNSNVTLLPKDLGNTTQNWIGKSQWPDALLFGSIDDFRIYSRVLSAAEVRYLAGDR